MPHPYEKSVLVRDPQRRAAWLATQGRCACCWITGGFPGVRLEAHHLVKAGVGGAGRSDELCCFLALCQRYGARHDWEPRCHSLAELEPIRRRDGTLWPKLPLAVCLALKLESDPENWIPERLAQIRHRNLPDLEPLPERLALERIRNTRRVA